MKNKDFITTQEWEIEDLEKILNKTADIKKNPEKYYNSLPGSSLCMYFFNPSTRTRNSFEVGISQLGGHAVYNDPKKSWFGQKSESLKDTASVLSRYHSAIGIRMFPNAVGWEYRLANKRLRLFAKYSSCPIINFEDDMYHPCQAISDIYTINEHFKGLKNKKFVLSWAYHPKPLPVSVPNSTLLAATRFGLDVTLACPPEFMLADDIMKMANDNAKKSGGSLTITHDIEEGYDGKEIVYVKSWGSLQQYGNPRLEKKLRVPYRDKWKCNKDLMDITAKNSVFMHCLPVRRNVVVTDDVIDGEHSIVYTQAENRLHSQKALMLELISNHRKQR